jgi:RHS repeat-associated protein
MTNMASPGAGNAGRFQYTGQVWLAELGMYYYKARIYSPTLGRFMQTDPMRDDNAALHSGGGVAGLMTRNRTFTIRAFPNGTFRTRQIEGPPLSGSERARLVDNMHNWEQRPDPGPRQPLATRVCH